MAISTRKPGSRPSIAKLLEGWLRGVGKCFLSCWAYLPGKELLITEVDVFTRQPLNFNPLLQPGSPPKGQEPGPCADHVTRSLVSAWCSDLRAGERCQRLVSGPWLVDTGYAAVGSGDSWERQMWSRGSKALSSGLSWGGSGGTHP